MSFMISYSRCEVVKITASVVKAQIIQTTNSIFSVFKFDFPFTGTYSYFILNNTSPTRVKGRERKNATINITLLAIKDLSYARVHVIPKNVILHD